MMRPITPTSMSWFLDLYILAQGETVKNIGCRSKSYITSKKQHLNFTGGCHSADVVTKHSAGHSTILSSQLLLSDGECGKISEFYEQKPIPHFLHYKICPLIGGVAVEHYTITIDKASHNSTYGVVKRAL